MWQRTAAKLLPANWSHIVHTNIVSPCFLNSTLQNFDTSLPGLFESVAVVRLNGQLADKVIAMAFGEKSIEDLGEWPKREGFGDSTVAVSYTHLTLPTIYSV